jgi:2-succinyl-5-enolpyruvyl-6-hydroxy-3-cyclohexene-1-carboxylate synthase
LGWPVIADGRSGCRVPSNGTVAAFDALLRDASFAAANRPDVVLRFGAPMTSRVFNEWLAASGADQVLAHPTYAWLDPERTVASLCASVTVANPVAAPAGWLEGWAVAERNAQAAIDHVLHAYDEITEPGVARTLLEALLSGSTLVASSSMPVRDLEWYGRPRAGVRMLANRGASGIDGVLSTTLGVAAGSGDHVTVALLGDLAFLHDAGGLLAARTCGGDCTIVVVDNDGGGIFSFLPQADAVEPARFETLFGTPHGLDLASIAAAYGVPVAHIETLDDLAGAAGECSTGVRVLIVRTNRAANVAVHREINAAVADAIRA